MVAEAWCTFDPVLSKNFNDIDKSCRWFAAKLFAAYLTAEYYYRFKCFLKSYHVIFSGYEDMKIRVLTILE